jgi:TPR repeat protein
MKKIFIAFILLSCIFLSLPAFAIMMSADRLMDVQAQYQFDLTYYNSENYSEALKAAEKGDAEAQNNLGWMYNDGKGVAKDKVEAEKWFRKAAEQGHIGAQYKLASMYYWDTKDKAEAEKWFRKAAEQGDAEAQNSLGWMYYINYDLDKAVKWLRKAAEQGHIDAQFWLGHMYSSIFDNGKEAEKWLKKSAEQGEILAQYYLGLMYYKGELIEEDLDEAEKWFRKAAEYVGNEYANGAISLLKQMGRY